jgi:hypothetical protein
VLSISADSIAAILAGKLQNGDTIQQKNLATTVDGIVLNSTVKSQVNPAGSYQNYDTANVLGAILDPSAPGANVFGPGKFVDNVHAVDLQGRPTFSIGDATNASTDGFVAAVKFGSDILNPSNVYPEALLTLKGIQSNFID